MSFIPLAFLVRYIVFLMNYNDSACFLTHQRLVCFTCLQFTLDFLLRYKLSTSGFSFRIKSYFSGRGYAYMR